MLTASLWLRRLGWEPGSGAGIVTDLTEDGYILKQKEGRRNRYHIQVDLPLRESVAQKRTIGEVLELLVEATVPGHRAASAYEWHACEPEEATAADVR
ncbi:MAG TPA: hypothetical protein VGV86_05920 [Acidimicrobiales bacterium]|nr:hypothetical protein [Acidimicrobiales bacterium]